VAIWETAGFVAMLLDAVAETQWRAGYSPGPRANRWSGTSGVAQFPGHEWDLRRPGVVHNAPVVGFVGVDALDFDLGHARKSSTVQAPC
jgi:hypothetical protein